MPDSSCRGASSTARLPPPTTPRAGVSATRRGLPFAPVNGSFQVLICDKERKVTRTTDVLVDLDGVDPTSQTTLNSLAARLNQINSISVQVTGDGNLSITSNSALHEFSFANDTSGVLAALGINTLFTGS